MKSLEDEFKLYSSKYNLNEIETIYIGGGNPALKIEDIKKIYKIIISNIKLKNIKEFTLESNPININRKLINLLKKINCNRVSLGIQSFDKNVLSYCNRKKQSLKIINKSLSILNKNNFNISIDLINGLPLTNYKYEIEKLNQILKKNKNIKHISFYDLSIEKGSYFYNKDKIRFNDDIDKRNYEKEFRKLIEKYNFKRYEISNYAKEEKYSLHNLNYWRYKNYIGIGPSAHSKINRLKIENKPDIIKYINNNNYKKSYILTKKELIQEYILMGLRLVFGIKIEEFYRIFNVSIRDLFKKNIKKYCLLKMIKISKNRIKILSRGMNILNKILLDFFIELDDYYKE